MGSDKILALSKQNGVAKTKSVAEKTTKVEGKTSGAVQTEKNPGFDLDYSPVMVTPPRHYR
jgi:hypothetical protein